MWRLLERRALPAAAPAPLRRRLSKYRPRRSAATWVTCALFILILAIMVFTRTRTQRPDLASFAIRAARRMHVRVHPPRVPGRPVRPAVVADVSDEDGMLDEEGITRDITADVHDPHAGRRYGEYFAGVRTPGAAAHGAAGATRLTARDFGGAFGLAVARGAVVSSGMRRRMRGHDVTRDAFYARLRRAGMLERYATRYASALVVGAKATVYVGRAGRGVLRRGCFASGSLRNGLVLGEYGGRYRPLREITDTEYAWELPALSDTRDEQWAVDAGEAANELRFCNDLGPGTWNVAVRYVPWNGIWHVVFETTAAVREDEELSVPYGAGYWARRQSE